VSAPKRILIVRLGAMGDIIHALPAAAALRAALPEASFGWVLERRWKDLLGDSQQLQDFPAGIDQVHTVDTRLWRKSPLDRSVWAEMRLAFGSLREAHYDIGIDLQGAIKSAVIVNLSGASDRYGFAHPWEAPAAVFYTRKIETNSVHVVEQAFDLAAAVAASAGAASLDRDACACLPHDLAAERQVGAQLAKLGISNLFAMINPGAGWGAKQWPADRYAKVARELGKDGVRSLVNFGPGEESLAKQVEQAAEGHAIAAQFTIPELIAATRRAALFIGGDTGPLHLAAALRIPAVALFGPTDPARTGPHGTRRVVLRDPSSVTSHKRLRETEAGLTNITAEQVISAARQLLNEGEHS
jgi:heptosyltransferase-1